MLQQRSVDAGAQHDFGTSKVGSERNTARLTYLPVSGVGRVVVGLILWAELYGSYLLFAGHVGMVGLLAGVPAAAVAALLGAMLHRPAAARG